MPDVAPESQVVLEIFGEGKTDIGKASEKPSLPDQGVVPIFVHRLCGKPATMRVKTKHYAHLHHKKSLWQKVRFAKRQARYNRDTRGVVFVLDTEGKDTLITEMAKGRDHELPDFPLAIGAAQPCIEAWLLVDSTTLQKTMALPHLPKLPEQPESLPAPARNRNHNPKSLLAVHGANSQPHKDALAQKLDLSVVRSRCPVSFEPFATEVERLIRPLFE